MPVGESVAIIGGDFHATQTAEFLVKRGARAAIVKSGSRIGENIPKNLVRPQILDWLYRNGVAMITDATVTKITDKGLVYTDKKGEGRHIEADTVITALSFLPDETLSNELKDVAPVSH